MKSFTEHRMDTLRESIEAHERMLAEVKNEGAYRIDDTDYIAIAFQRYLAERSLQNP